MRNWRNRLSGVINTYNEMHPGHVHLNRLGQLVKDGVREAGGIPFEIKHDFHL